MTERATCSTPATGSGDRASSRCDDQSLALRIVVTGGAGFIGANLCRMLNGQDFVDHVVALDDLSTGSRQNLAGSPTVELTEGSILNVDDLDLVMEGAQAVVHLAARPSVSRSLADPVATHEVNATGTMMVLEAARRHGTPHVVVASSSSVYGANPALPKREDMAPMPVSPYAASKLAAESYALSYERSFGLPVLAFRFFNVFGPLQPAGHAYAAVVPTFISCALAGTPLAGARRRHPDPRLHLCRHRRLGAHRRHPSSCDRPRAREPGLRVAGLAAGADRRAGAGRGPRAAAATTPGRGPATCTTRRPTGRASVRCSRMSDRRRCKKACRRPWRGSRRCADGPAAATPADTPVTTASPSDGGRVVLLAGPDDSTDIVANFLASRVRDLVVVVEDPPSRLRMARRRARRVGWIAVAGQVLFVGLLQPVLRRRGAGRRAAILGTTPSGRRMVHPSTACPR